MNRLDEIREYARFEAVHHSDVLYLLAEVDRLRKEIDRLRTARDVDRLGYAVVDVDEHSATFELISSACTDRRQALDLFNEVCDEGHHSGRPSLVEIVKVEEVAD